MFRRPWPLAALQEPAPETDVEEHQGSSEYLKVIGKGQIPHISFNNVVSRRRAKCFDTLRGSVMNDDPMK